MKKKLLSVLLITALGASLLAGCSSEKDSVSDKTEKKVEEKLTKVTLNEVAHSIFYAPMYVAIEEDYFKDEGIDLELVTGLQKRGSKLCFQLVGGMRTLVGHLRKSCYPAIMVFSVNMIGAPERIRYGP